jgi:ATP:ADP antiporter, AAA family
MFISLIQKREAKRLFLMFAIMCLLTLNFTLLRNLRSTIVVADLSGSASYIPFFELFGTVPSAVVLTFLLMRLLNRFSMQRVFFIAMGGFLSFFLAFAFFIYPSLSEWKRFLLTSSWLPGHAFLAENIGQAFSLAFYVLAELWKVILLTLLFWGLVNQYTSLSKAKTVYAPLMLAGSLGSLLSGPLITICSSETAWSWIPLSHDEWRQALSLMMLSICFIGLLTAGLYHLLWKQLALQPKTEDPKAKTASPLSLLESFKFCVQSPYLRLLAWIVFVDYIAYCVGELIFLEILKERFPLPRDYCAWMGNLSFWGSLITLFNSLFLTPLLLNRCRWIVAALITPFCLLITQGAFFAVLQLKPWLEWSHMQWLESLVLVGSLQYCLCRSTKCTFFDVSKELAFVHLAPLEKLKGKLVIDGVCARFGRGGSSVLSILLIGAFGSIIASSALSGILALFMTLTWILATHQLGNQIDNQAPVPLDLKRAA